jgi:hypothetical protein
MPQNPRQRYASLNRCPTWLGIVLAGLSAACGAADPFEFCDDAHNEELTKATGEFRVEFQVDKSEAPESSFETYVRTLDDGSFQLAACQVNRIGQLWHFRTTWSGASSELTQRTEANFEENEGQEPISVRGFMYHCLDESCHDQVQMMGFPLSQEVQWLDWYSKSSGKVKGGMIETVPRTTNQEALVQVYFDLQWEPDGR